MLYPSELQALKEEAHNKLFSRSQKGLGKVVALESRVLHFRNGPIGSNHQIMRTAVYAGSFDPPTNGHLWMIERGLEMFDRLIVAIGSNPSKTYSFTVEERLNLLERSTHLHEGLEIEYFDNRYLVDYATKMGAKFVLRGIRSPNDYEYERVMRHINSDMAPVITTVFLMPPRDIAELSSNMIKSLTGPTGWESIVRRYVPEPVFEALAARGGSL